MSKIEMLLTYFLGPLVLLTVLVACLFGLNYLLVRIQATRPGNSIHRQVVMLLATLVTLFLLIILLPIGDTLRGQILSLLGILLSATIALSSTTFLGNALAGVLLRNVRSFRTGDFIYIKEHFGRVSGRGIFHIEIQTADSDLVTLPNLYVTNNPVKVTRGSGTVVSAEVSLGYDVPRRKVEDLLVDAASGIGLENPFVHIMQLGDFSVLYRVNGMLIDVKQLLSVRSRLHGAILDTLHAADIEIVSPNFMNTRNVSDDRFLDRAGHMETEEPDTVGAEEIIFEKADKAETIDEMKEALSSVEAKIQTAEKELAGASDDTRDSLMKRVERLGKEHKRLSQAIERSTKLLENE